MAALNVGPAFWNPPPDVIEAGRIARVSYTDGPLAGDVDRQYRGLLRTQVPIAPGTIALRDRLVREFSVPQTYMPGRSRPMLDTQKLDLHQSGRALDAMTNADHAKGCAVANFCVLHAEEIGIQFVVFARNRWSGGQPRDRRWAAYGGGASHNDHPHIELTTRGAALGGTWRDGRQPEGTARGIAAMEGPTAPYGDRGSALDEYGFYIAGGALLTVGIVGALIALRKD